MTYSVTFFVILFEVLTASEKSAKVSYDNTGSFMCSTPHCNKSYLHFNNCCDLSLYKALITLRLLKHAAIIYCVKIKRPHVQEDDGKLNLAHCSNDEKTKAESEVKLTQIKALSVGNCPTLASQTK